MRKTENRTIAIGGFYLSERARSPFQHATWFDPATRQTKRVSLGTADVREAEIRLAEFVAKNARMQDHSPTETSLAAVLLRYWHGHVCRVDSQGRLFRIASHDQAKQALALWNDHWGNAAISDLTMVRQEAFIIWLKDRGYKNAYVSRVLSVGRAAINRAHKRQEIAAAPFIIDESDRSDQEVRYRLSMDEVGRLLSTAGSKDRWRHLLVFCIISLNTLQRPGAVLDLRPSQVDFEMRRIDFNVQGRRRTKKRRAIVPITHTLLPFLSNESVLRFVNWHGASIKSVKKGFAKIVQAAALNPEITPYSLRHTMASELRRRGVPMWEVEGLLAHKVGRETETYAQFDPDYLSKGSQAIDAYFGALELDLCRFVDPRADCVPHAWHIELCPRTEAPENSIYSSEWMVGVTGIEPVTPTMST